MAAQFDPILYSDWDAIQTVIYDQLGPLQERSGNPGIYVEGTGYGLAQSQLTSRAYPFVRNITNFSSEVQPTITFATAHNLVVGEVLFFSNFNNSWGGQPIVNNFATVQNVIDSTRVLVDFSTFGYPAWNIATDTAEAQQYYISANQFVNLRADLAKVVQHITGAPPGPGTFFAGGEATELPTPLRGDIIYHSVYDPYYTVATAAQDYKFHQAPPSSGESAQVSPSLGSLATNNNAWNGQSDLELAISWPGSDGYDFVQFFNTGGFVILDMNPTGYVGDANNDRVANLNGHWRDMINGVFPIYIGARSKNVMNLASDPRNIAASGAFDALGVYSTIASKAGNTVSGYGSSYNDHSIQVQMKQVTNQKDLYFKIILTDTSQTNTYARQVDINRNLTITFQYSTGSVPLASIPNSYTISILNGW